MIHATVPEGRREAAGGELGRMGEARVTVRVSGHVQGVGFRWWTRARALELGLSGHATNLDDGRVEVIAQGSRQACEDLLAMLSQDPPRDLPPGAERSVFGRPGRVPSVTVRWAEPREGLSGFTEG